MANPTATNSGWTVEYQQPAVEVGRDGKAVKGMRVAFVTGKGVHADVFLPWADYSVENARKAINERVQVLDAVHALNG